jgi:tetratricopeptide (TPR) repeat protein
MAWQRGERERAVTTLREAVEQIENAPLSRAKAVVLFQLARLGSVSSAPDAVAAGEDAVAAARELGVRDLEARALNSLGVARIHRGDRDGLADIERSLTLAEEIVSPVDISRAHGNIASMTFGFGDVERSFQAHVAALAAAERWGLGTPAKWFAGERPEYEYHAGRWDEALRRADEFVAEVEAGSPHYMEAQVRPIRSLVRLGRGDIAGALEDDRRSVELGRSLGDPQAFQPTLAVSAFVQLQAGDSAEALDRFEELVALWRGDSRVAQFNPSELAFAAVGLERGDEFLAAAADAPRTRWLEAASAFARGEFTRAADLFREIGSTPNEAYSRLLGGGHEDVRRALDFYRSVRAVHYSRRGEARLAASA